MTRNVIFTEQDHKDVDGEELHATIKAQLGEKFYGVSTSPESYVLAENGEVLEFHPASVTLHFDDRVTGAEISKARLAYDQHDITKIPTRPKPKTEREEIDELKVLVAQLIAERAGSVEATPK